MPPHPKDRPGPRKDPKQVRSTETVGFIVEAAARILETQGHGAFSTNSVASRAGVSIGTLYQYFPNKDAIVGALLARETAQFLADAEAAPQKSNAEDALSDLILAAVKHQFTRPRLARLLDFEEARLPLDAPTQDIGRRVTEVVERLLDRLGLSGQGERRVAARDVVAIIKGIIDTAGSNAEADPSALAARVRRAVFGYLSLDGSAKRDRAGAQSSA
jgi:AcrR family transcriptional regulator